MKVKSTMAFRTQSLPIFNFSSVFVIYIRPMIYFCFSRTALPTNSRLSSYILNPNVGSSIARFFSFPSRAFLTEEYSNMGNTKFLSSFSTYKSPAVSNTVTFSRAIFSFVFISRKRLTAIMTKISFYSNFLSNRYSAEYGAKFPMSTLHMVWSRIKFFIANNAVFYHIRIIPLKQI